ncbi:hypothetical protein BKA67DRAFT_663016 [Truncatella angustata]|uniref:Uncharacterized protein n=1 Tax=Truncatella angustata TaxID=152316 RepID=A0A9P8UCS7_9PEZI|nr:uncharacterized protein BKA67DRAFT_663016 [Truncatella angustata]KAH6646610.1 hypothetical protein BKA67DRAFT_663016 [Truncatella angustata]
MALVRYRDGDYGLCDVFTGGYKVSYEETCKQQPVNSAQVIDDQKAEASKAHIKPRLARAVAPSDTDANTAKAATFTSKSALADFTVPISKPPTGPSEQMIFVREAEGQEDIASAREIDKTTKTTKKIKLADKAKKLLMLLDSDDNTDTDESTNGVHGSPDTRSYVNTLDLSQLPNTYAKDHVAARDSGQGMNNPPTQSVLEINRELDSDVPTNNLAHKIKAPERAYISVALRPSVSQTNGRPILSMVETRSRLNALVKEKPT